MRVVAISDVHCRQNKIQIPECDLLISVGDYSFRGEKHVVEDYHKWLSKQPARHIISIQGNHETWVEANFAEAKQVALKACPRVHFVSHELVEIEGIKIFCSAWSPWFHNWAYNGARNIHEAMLYQKPMLVDLWKDIPNKVDIVATHTPVYEILDELTYVDGTPKGQFVGCVDLRDKLLEVKPKVHLCGHIHSQGGKHVNQNGIDYYNVAICDEMYAATNSVTVFDI